MFIKNNENSKVLKKVPIYLSMFLVVLFLVIPSACASEINVNNTMSLTNIQNLINSAEEGSTIIFNEGNYDFIFNLNITKPLKLLSNGVVNLVGNIKSNAFIVKSADVMISGFNINNYNKGITSEYYNGNLTGLNISKNNISANEHGIYLRTYGNVENNTISNNNIQINNNSSTAGAESKVPIAIWTSNGNVSNNNISNNNISTKGGSGVYMYTSTGEIRNNKVNENNINTTGNGRSGINIISTNGTTKNNVVSKNKLKTKQNGIVISGKSNKNNVINHNKINNTNMGDYAGGIYVTANYMNSNQNEALNNKIHDNEIICNGNSAIGVSIIGGNNINGINIKNNQIYNNNITSSYVGTWIYSMDTSSSSAAINNEIYNNKITGEYGIYLLCDNTTVKSNNITKSLYGIYNDGNYNKIFSNNLLKNVYGIYNEGNKTTINYNRLVNNTNSSLINNGLNTNANLNWWGINNISNEFKDNVGDLNITNWYMLKIYANNHEIISNGNNIKFPKGTKVILKSLLELNNKNINNDKTLLPYFEDIFQDIDNTTTNSDARSFNYTKTINGKNESYYIKTLADNQLIGLNVIFTSNGTNKTVILDTDKPSIEAKKDSKIVIKYPISTNSSQPTNITVKFNIPKEFEIINAISSLNKGIIKIDRNSNTITWTINGLTKNDNLVLGLTLKPLSELIENDNIVLGLNSKAFKTETYYIKTTMSSSDENTTLINNAKNKIKITMNKPNPNNNTDEKHAKNIITSASMKSTGIPLIAVLLVLLASLGLIVRRK
ncbi:hypothetical protein KQY27_05315 [Methanobrevibacter sp. TMH8]|uniref:hypothetical protein n=1 Tax=Methanobrevibacter sp. TMH8 TaxID=2848611 RepID=UPI001CC92AA7|nr:hypothetical protein [Methanobrevibacter sp. TMH8]MBZ9570960.1 hypothetical protein [Methanobrevibacter sp. TMH8]